MTIHALASGTIFRPPKQRISKTSGKQFVAVTFKVGSKDDGSQWLKVLAFGETAQAELLRLSDGEAVSVQGALIADIYQPDGREARVSLTLFADAVMPLRAAPKPKTPPAQKPNANRSETEQSPPRAAFDDDYDFRGP